MGITHGESCALGKDHLQTEKNKTLGGGCREGEERQKLKGGKREGERERNTGRHTEKQEGNQPTVTQTLKLNFLAPKLSIYTQCSTGATGQRLRSGGGRALRRSPPLSCPDPPSSRFAVALRRPEQHRQALLSAPYRLAPEALLHGSGIVLGAQDWGWGAALGRLWGRTGGGRRQRKRFCFAVRMSSSLAVK